MDAFRSILELKDTPNGKGVFAKTAIAPGTVIFECKGDVLSRDQLPTLTPENDHYLQIGKDTFLGPSGDLDDFFNHHCNPNCGIRIVGHRALVLTLYEVKPGTELTFDYATTSTDTPDIWKLDCKCGDHNCRKTISGFKLLSEPQQQYYIRFGIVPDYLTKI